MTTYDDLMQKCQNECQNWGIACTIDNKLGLCSLCETELKRQEKKLDNEEMLDKAIQYLVDLETEIPCEEMSGYTDYCEENCEYSCPQKECWRYFLSGKWKDE